MKHSNINTVKGLTISNDILEAMEMNDTVTLTASPNVLVVKNTQMTAMEVIKTIEGLRGILVELYTSLLTSCLKCDGCINSNTENEDTTSNANPFTYCENINHEDDLKVPEWAVEEAGLEVGTKFDIFVEEGSGRIILEPSECQDDISDISQEIQEQLSQMGVCFGELSERIILEEIVYEG